MDVVYFSLSAFATMQCIEHQNFRFVNMGLLLIVVKPTLQ